MTSPWADAAVWGTAGLEREVFFFRAGRHDLYGSFYRPVPPTSDLGLVICPGWAVESARVLPFRLALRAAEELGMPALVFHYPGAGDSFGNLESATMSDLRDAAVAAVAEADRRAPGTRWILAGSTLGAGVAALAWREAGVERLLLLQPTLDARAYFDGLRHHAARMSGQAGSADDVVYGHPLPSWLRAEAAPADSPAEALRAFDGDGAIVRYPAPAPAGPPPAEFETIVVDGSFTPLQRQNPELSSCRQRSTGSRGCRRAHLPP